jgi:hypothetical protein
LQPAQQVRRSSYGCHHWDPTHQRFLLQFKAGASRQQKQMISQVGLFWILPGTGSAAVLTALSFIILMCYGGGLGTIPAFAADYFG